MCGITGVCYKENERTVDEGLLQKMAGKLEHRGPDESKYVTIKNVGFGFRRLSIIDLKFGSQPFYSEDKSIILICNGEIFNYKELKKELLDKGYSFHTDSDIEVLIPLYMHYGVEFLKKLNGQFSMAIYDRRKDFVVLARDHFGICPLFYTEQDNALIFGSEIKAILEYPNLDRKIDLRGLDQLLTFPSSVSPTTIFSKINSLPPGNFAVFKNGKLETHEYWDLDYPDSGFEYEQKSEAYYLEGIEDLLLKSVQYRLNADVPVGFYLSGGLDSSLIGGLMHRINPTKRFDSFSASFGNSSEHKTINEQKYQLMMSNHLATQHNDVEFSWENVEKRLKDVVYFSETPLKETYNLCSLSLSEAARKKDIKVILSGEGADELFGGYAGYKFDAKRGQAVSSNDLEELLDEQVRETIWGDRRFIYEKNEHEFEEVKLSLYSKMMRDKYSEFNCLQNGAVNKNRMKGKHIFHQRSYADFRLRLSGHLIADHGDRMTLANSVEGRYPFLDVNLIEFTRKIPPQLMLNHFNEKYLLKRIAEKYVPSDIINREKFGFVAPGSSVLLKNNNEWILDLLSCDHIKKQGYFDPNTIERLKKLYTSKNFVLNPPYDTDLLIIVITFTLLVDLFKMDYL